MNPYKKQEILQHIRRQGRLPMDRFGNVMSPEDLLVWFDLAAILNGYEQKEIKMELAALAEAERFLDDLRLRLG